MARGEAALLRARSGAARGPLLGRCGRLSGEGRRCGARPFAAGAVVGTPRASERRGREGAGWAGRAAVGPTRRDSRSGLRADLRRTLAAVEALL